MAALQAPRNDLMLEDVVEPGRYTCTEGPFEHYERTLDVESLGQARYRVTETTRWVLAIPIWGVLFRPLVRKMVVRREAPEPVAFGPGGEPVFISPWWSPPARFNARSSQILSRLCALSLLAGYLGTVITQTITFAADEFGASSTAQGTTLAAIRVGVLLSVGIMAISDRKGRQKLLLATAVGSAIFAAMGALSPGLVFLGSTQTLSRACSTAMALLIAVVAAEEMPAGGRAYAASVLAMTGALGAGLAVMLVPLADMAPWAWRVIYVVPVLFLPLFISVGRRLPESRRFVRPHGRATMAGHRRRLLLLATVAFFGLMFWAPNTQFHNDFLRNEHGFSAAQLTLFTLATGTPAGIGIVIGGRLADTRGRRMVGAIGTIGGASLLALSYLV
ncbi:MAG: MFS transporter, partial [Aquihabitans sp.]